MAKRFGYLGALAGLSIGLASGSMAQTAPPVAAPAPVEASWITDRESPPVALAPDVDAARLDAEIAAAMAAEVPDMGQTRTLVVIHRGRLVREAYGAGITRDTKLVSWSVAKSITHGLVGRAVALGLIADIDAAMPSLWPASDPRAAITWRQWMQMTDGLDYLEIGATSVVNDVSRMTFGAGRRDVVTWFSGHHPPKHAPGAHWNYTTGGVNLIAWALQSLAVPETLTGMARAEASFAWMQASLFGPLGMQAVPEFDAAGTFLGGSLVYASARDFARFGQLYLQDGVWQGQRLLPEGWAAFADTPGTGSNTDSYGALFWITPNDGGPGFPRRSSWVGAPLDGYHAQGHEGQIITIVPSRELVVVRLGVMNNGQPGWDALYDWAQRVVLAFPER
jgi:CubicO group peptidase (beta-lactamase class C family)